MKHFVGIGLGLVGGLLLNLEIGALSILSSGSTNGSDPSPALTIGVILWTLPLSAICAFPLLFRAPRVSSAILRGLALNVVLWAAMIPLTGAIPQLAVGSRDPVPGRTDAFEVVEVRRYRDAADALESTVATVASIALVLSTAGFAATILATRRRVVAVRGSA